MNLGHELMGDVGYVKATRCKRCDKQFAYEERESPDIKEVSAPKSYMITVIRYWKCRYCGYEDNTESPENIGSRKGEIQNSHKLSKIACANCGTQGSYKEFRKPDEKIIDGFSSTHITTRYYNCKVCGYIDIKMETETRSSN